MGELKQITKVISLSETDEESLTLLLCLFIVKLTLLRYYEL